MFIIALLIIFVWPEFVILLIELALLIYLVVETGLSVEGFPNLLFFGVLNWEESSLGELSAMEDSFSSNTSKIFFFIMLFVYYYYIFGS